MVEKELDTISTESVAEDVTDAEATGNTNVSEETEASGNTTLAVVVVVVICVVILVILQIKRKNK